MTNVEIFHLGPPKTGTTWLYECMREHPEVATTARDTVHYYDIFYAYGSTWYSNQFPDWTPGMKRLDATPSYIQCRKALERLVEDSPGAQFIIGLREPIDRAFSHYWHLKKQRRITYSFDQILDNYTLFSLWLEPGLIARNLRAVLDVIPLDHIYTMRYEDLKEDSTGEWKNVLEFCGIDTSVRPAVVGNRINAAGPRYTFPQRAIHKVGKFALGKKLDEPGGARVFNWLSGKSEYHKGVPTPVVDKLQHICDNETHELEDLLQVDLSHWLKYSKSRNIIGI